MVKEKGKENNPTISGIRTQVLASRCATQLLWPPLLPIIIIYYNSIGPNRLYWLYDYVQRQRIQREINYNLHCNNQVKVFLHLYQTFCWYFVHTHPHAHTERPFLDCIGPAKKSNQNIDLRVAFPDFYRYLSPRRKSDDKKATSNRKLKSKKSHFIQFGRL